MPAIFKVTLTQDEVKRGNMKRSSHIVQKAVSIFYSIVDTLAEVIKRASFTVEKIESLLDKKSFLIDLNY